jgi:hypothetical protein
MRVLNRVLALLVSLAVIAVGVVVIIEVIAQRVGVDPVVVNWHATYRWAQRTSWNAGVVLLICVLLAVLGLALLAAQFKPRRPGRLPLRSDQPAIDLAITRRSLTSTIRGAVGDVNGVTDARVAVRRRRIRVRAHARAPHTADGAPTREAVTQAAQRRLDALQLRRSPKLAVRISAGEG